MPSMVIWNRKTLAPELTIGVKYPVHYTAYLVMDGWIWSCFMWGFETIFLRYAPAIRPILLLLDGYSSHYCPETIHFSAQEQFILFVMPPNTTGHLIKGVLGPLKVSWRKECHQYLSENPGRVVTKFQFSEIFNRAWTQSMTMANIVAGFKVTGIYPLNRHALSPPIFEAEKLSQETGLSASKMDGYGAVSCGVLKPFS